MRSRKLIIRSYETSQLRVLKGQVHHEGHPKQVKHENDTVKTRNPNTKSSPNSRNIRIPSPMPFIGGYYFVPERKYLRFTLVHQAPSLGPSNNHDQLQASQSSPPAPPDVEPCVPVICEQQECCEPASSRQHHSCPPQ